MQQTCQQGNQGIQPILKMKKTTVPWLSQQHIWLAMFIFIQLPCLTSPHPLFYQPSRSRKKGWMITWGIPIGNLQVNRFQPLVNYHRFLQFASEFVDLLLKNGDVPMFLFVRLPEGKFCGCFLQHCRVLAMAWAEEITPPTTDQRKLGSNTSELQTNRILRLQMMKGGMSSNNT